MPSVGPVEIVVILVILAMFVVPVIALAVYLSGRSSARTVITDPDPAMDILRRRLAAGEIDEREFERRRLVLRSR